VSLVASQKGMTSDHHLGDIRASKKTGRHPIDMLLHKHGGKPLK
jgi:hypothetical protein